MFVTSSTQFFLIAGKSTAVKLRQKGESSSGHPPPGMAVLTSIPISIAIFACHAAADVRRLVFDADAAADSFDPVIDVVHDDKNAVTGIANA